ncbi:MAG TPA: hypothetical protein DD409_03450 [Bacteroidales bacterium]|nr:hypothetical protein [Bacteroidales bacterium]
MIGPLYPHKRQILTNTRMKTLLTALLFSLATVTLTAQETPLTLNLQKGQPITIKTHNKQRIQQTASGQQMAFDVSTDRVVTANLLEKTAQELTLSITYDTLRSVTKSAMFNRETNSALPGNEPIEKVLNKLSQTAMVVKITPTGRFLRFENYAQLREDILRVLDDVPASKKDAALKQAEALIKESALRSMVEPLFSYLPEKAVKVGETWETSYISTSNDISSIVLSNNTVKSQSEGSLTYTTVGQLESLPATDPNAQISMDIKGSSTGEGSIDIKTGLRPLDTEKASYKGTTTVKQMGQETSIPMTIDSESTTIMTW